MAILHVGSAIFNPQDLSPAIIFAHADADGHLAAEQTRSNLCAADVNVADIVVGAETKSYKFWEKTFWELDLGQYKLVVVVDIAFDFRNPDRSSVVVMETVNRHPDTHFVIIDHHPLEQVAACPQNLTLVEVGSAYECCLGAPSDELMVVAAICDGDGKFVRSRTSAVLLKRAVGVRRAAADMNGISGSTLLALLRNREWGFFESLAEEPGEYHKIVRGRRTAKSLMSPLLESARNDEI